MHGGASTGPRTELGKARSAQNLRLARAAQRLKQQTRRWALARGFKVLPE
jgi:hypothetical protein